ncbi:hypothetical protein MLD38_005503 [Melastoma candidum]|uniref:Uncharacterized protein n=1 Tax=Melastoma candidum TaxID=119954 RepID=A0ACB9RP22_9MYRT|nr:hypothetical protein MLD38_005503 [Melastoma candidum]
MGLNPGSKDQAPFQPQGTDPIQTQTHTQTPFRSTPPPNNTNPTNEPSKRANQKKPRSNTRMGRKLLQSPAQETARRTQTQKPRRFALSPRQETNKRGADFSSGVSVSSLSSLLS